MRILALSHIFPPAVDGGSQIVYNLAAGLLKQKHQVIFLSSRCNSTDEFIQNPFARLLRKLKLPSGPFFNLKDFIKVILFKPDWIISGPLPTTIIFYTRIFQILTRSKVLFIPCYHENDTSFNQKYFFSILKHFHLWVFTQHEKTLLSSYSKNIIQHFPGINKIFLKAKKNKNKANNQILFLGNLAAHKGIIELIKSLNLLPKTYKLTIMGQKTLFLPTIKLAITKNLSKQVNLITKKFSASDAIRQINRSSILVLPSTQESFGLVLAESISQLVPVVGLNIPTTREVIHSLGLGLVSPSSSPTDIATSIQKAQMLPVSISANKIVQDLCNWDNIAKWVNDYLSSH